MSIRKKSHTMTVTAMLGAVAVVLMLLEFPVPFLIPDFVKMDFSELPALLAAFSLGPVSGVTVCFIKNAVHAFFTTTGCIGELCNFLLGCCFVIPAGLLYQRKKSRKNAILGAALGALAMAVCSVPINYFISYPVYTAFIPLEGIIAMYQALIPAADSLLKCLIIFNAPFTLLKGILNTVLAFLIYKPLSPLLHK